MTPELDPGHDRDAAHEGVGDWDTATRIAVLLEVVQSFAVLDFERTAPVGRAADDIDALAAGINMLGEEIRAARDDLERRVSERTAELVGLTSRLEIEIAQRRKAERRLEDANRQLGASVEHLRWMNQRVGRLTELSNLLQGCASDEEAFAVLQQLGPELFDVQQGTVYVYGPTRDRLECRAGWGSGSDRPSLPPRACWALRRGRVHRAHDGGPRCEHLERSSSRHALCLPLSAQGEVIGVLHLGWDAADDDARPGPPVPTGADETALRDFERFTMAASEQVALALANVQLRTALQTQSVRDALTGLYNRRHLDRTLAHEVDTARRHGQPLALLMVDLDRFKPLNDAHGHAAGDAVLREVAWLLGSTLRGEDVLCRYGGEEFAVVMAGATATAASARAEDVRAAIESAAFTWGDRSLGRVTISVGVAGVPEHARDVGELLEAADAALYDAKVKGRNQVRVSEQTPAAD